MKKRKEDLKELVLYTVFGNMTFIISIASYAVFNVALGINELIANALAWVFAVLFSYITNKRWVFRKRSIGGTLVDLPIFLDN